MSGHDDPGGRAPRVAIVTGSGRGIGKGYARALAEHGHRVVIADLIEDNAERTAEEITARGGEAMAVRADVADPDAVGAMVDATVRRFGTVDVLVNNAALFGADIEFNPLGWDPLDGSLEQYHRAMSVNVDSIVYCSRAVAPIMTAKGWGRIINQSSAGVYYDIGNLYSLTKLAVISVTRMYARALARSGVTVNALAPGITVTEAILNRFDREEDGRAYAADFAENNVPMGRPGTIDDLLGPLLFLVSDASSYVTAQSLSVDGGWLNRI
jgi:NAD(P)-dependent dehydrogenase (short-subunit alcohol dehydrogenase family)